MRITVDLDSKSRARLKICKKIGGFFSRLLGDGKSKFRETKHGYHLIWYGFPPSFPLQIFLRFLLQDDTTRIALDLKGGRKPEQVLFCVKKVREVNRQNETGLF